MPCRCLFEPASSRQPLQPVPTLSSRSSLVPPSTDSSVSFLRMPVFHLRVHQQETDCVCMFIQGHTPEGGRLFLYLQNYIYAKEKKNRKNKAMYRLLRTVCLKRCNQIIPLKMSCPCLARKMLVAFNIKASLRLIPLKDLLSQFNFI